MEFSWLKEAAIAGDQDVLIVDECTNDEILEFINDLCNTDFNDRQLAGKAIIHAYLVAAEEGAEEGYAEGVRFLVRKRFTSGG